MGNISSIHFKKSIYIQTKHNDRTLPPSYLIGGEVEVNRNHQEADILKKEIIDKAMRKYTERTKQKFQGKSFEWSAVVNLKEDSTMQDLERLALHFQENYGLQCYQIAIHRDEGHIDENGEKKLNHHAHLEFITLDKNTGVNRFREIKLPTLRKIQSEVAQILGMERGVDNRISKTKRIEPRAYASLKERDKNKNLSKIRKELIKEYTEQMKGKGYKQTDFQAMRGIANDEECKNVLEIRQNIEDYLKDRAKEMEQLKSVENSEETRQFLKKSNEMLLNANEEIKTLKKENESLKKRINSLSKAIRNFKRRIRKWWNKDKQNKFYKDTQLEYQNAVIGVAKDIIVRNSLGKEFEISVIELTDKERGRAMREEQRKQIENAKNQWGRGR